MHRNKMLPVCLLLAFTFVFMPESAVCQTTTPTPSKEVKSDPKPSTDPEAAPDPKITPVSDQEKIGILSAQKELLEATDALKNTAEYKRFVDAQAELNRRGQIVFTVRHLDSSHFTLCDGPTVGPCKDVAKGDIQLRSTATIKDDSLKDGSKK